MTTIATKDGQMAADTQLSGDYVVRVQKIHLLPSGGIVGGCGVWHLAYAAIDWLLRPSGDAPLFEDCTLLALYPDGSLHIAENRFPFYPLLDRFAAIGCGSQVAMAAMAGGATAGEAVKVAARIDPSTNGSVQMLELPKAKRRK